MRIRKMAVEIIGNIAGFEGEGMREELRENTGIVALRDIDQGFVHGAKLIENNLGANFMRALLGAAIITMLTALTACSEDDCQRQNSADANCKVAEGREVPIRSEYTKTPEWVPANYRRLSDDEISDLLNSAKLLSYADERTTIILKAGHSYEMKSFGNRMNGGIASHGNWIVEGDALLSEREGIGALILFVQLQDTAEIPGENIFGFFDKSDARELSQFTVTAIANDREG